MKIETMKIGDLKPNPKNPRKIAPSAMSALAESMNKFGLVQPIIFNKRSGFIVGGHQRLEVLKKGKKKTTEVIIVDLDDKGEKALMVSLNNPNSQGTFDYNALQDVMDELKMDFSADELESLGFKNLIIESDDLKPDSLEDFDVDESEFLERERVIISYDSKDKEGLENFLGVKLDKIIWKYEEIKKT